MSLFHLKVTGRGPCPDFPHDQEDQLRAIGESDSRVILGKRFGHRRRRSYELRWDKATEGQAWELEYLFGRVGTKGTMNYVPPDETAIVEVRFQEPVRITRLAAMHFEMSAKVEEALR